MIRPSRGVFARLLVIGYVICAPLIHGSAGWNGMHMCQQNCASMMAILPPALAGVELSAASSLNESSFMTKCSKNRPNIVSEPRTGLRRGVIRSKRWAGNTPGEFQRGVVRSARLLLDRYGLV